MSATLIALGCSLAGLAAVFLWSRSSGDHLIPASAAPKERTSVRTSFWTSTDSTPPGRHVRNDGDRHLVVGLRLHPESVVVSSVALAHGRPPQLLAPGHPWLAAVTREDQVVHLSRVPDPFLRHGHAGRAGGREEREPGPGRAVVAVPFGSTAELAGTRIHVLDLADRRMPSDRQSLRGELDRRLAKGSGVRTVGFAAIQASAQWATVGPLLGMPVDPGRFEVYRDRTGQWRWRLRRSSGEVVAASNDGYASRAEVEAEVTWIRRYAGGSPSTAVD